MKEPGFNGMSQGLPVALVNDCIECPSEDLLRNSLQFCW